MPTNDSLGRAPLKRAGLALFAALACTAPATAQTLNIADILANINEHCEGMTRSDDVVKVITGRVAATGSQLSLEKELVYLNPERIGRHTFSSFDLRRVDIEKALSTNTSTYMVRFTCSVRNCVSERLQVEGRFESDDTLYYSTQIDCREKDRVVNAFKRLQQLLGGRIADPVDPFAN